MSHDYIEESTPQAVDSFNFLSALDSIIYFFLKKNFLFSTCKGKLPQQTRGAKLFSTR